ncbi:unnamed protein product [Miscanthus lutarioriparius]|uniref:Uncharacterized protein n=1 Tax=Miscanthus lutarioriparius TaxID=422564 RepID=A0A811P274_9POAL|nr:unnamed protein product [Miscanthus lutarioriparius]
MAAPPASIPSGGDARIQIPQPSTATAADLIRESSAAAPTSPMSGSTPPPVQLKAPSPASTTTAAPKVIDKTLASMANLAKLLPTGTALAFHSLSPSFTNRGACLASNRYLTAALLYLCFVSCVFYSFTDSFSWFLTVAFSDAAVQSCYFPDSSNNVKQLLTNLPLGAGFLSSMVFVVFPTTRKGFDYTGRFTNA